MPVTLAESKNNTTTDYDPAVIDEFRKSSVIADMLIFDDVVSPTGGGTLSYGYRRLATQATADTRAINTEYTPQEVSTVQVFVTLAVLGGAFQVDRVIANAQGPAASGAVALNTAQKIKAASAKFSDLVINGDIATDAAAFDGLNKALLGSSTEFRPNTVTDMRDLDTNAATKFTLLDLLDEFLGTLDGAPTVLLGNQKLLAKIRAITRRTGMYVVNPIDGLLDAATGQPIQRQSYGGAVFADTGAKAGSNNPIIPILSRDMDNAVVTQTVTGTPAGGSYTVTVAVSGGTSFTTAAIAYNAAGSAVQSAIAALPNVGVGNVSVSGSGPYTVTFTGSLQYAGVTMTLAVNSLTGGSSPSVTFVNSGTGAVSGLTDLYAVRVGLDGFHGLSTVGGQVTRLYLPDFSTPGAVKTGEVEMGPVAVALKATKAAAVWRNIQVQ